MIMDDRQWRQVREEEERRGGIDDAASQKEAAEKYAAHMETQRPTQKVINLR